MKWAAATAVFVAASALALAADSLAQPKEPFTPGLGEFMMATQVRHAKLWLAGDARNWELADYEIDELKEGLEETAKIVPTYKNMPVGAMIENTMKAPIAEVEAAVKSRDRAKFAAAYDKLTQACNACHQAANRPFIVLQRPTGSPFPNQSFAPRRN